MSVRLCSCEGEGAGFGKMRLGLIFSCLVFFFFLKWLIFTLRLIDAAAGMGSGQNIVKCLGPTHIPSLIWRGCLVI